MNLNIHHRTQFLQEAALTHYDIIIIGGGITGAGIALDAASRGLKTLLLEKQGFAAGTSSRSTKLIHGGLRYLKQLELGLVREVGLERAIVHRLAPHLVVPEKMLIPLSKKGSLGKWSTSLALWLYDFLAKVDPSEQRKMLNKADTLTKEPLLNAQLIIGSGYYAEYRTDDARLTIEIIKKAVELGAHCFNHVEVREFIYQDTQVAGVIATDRIHDQAFQVKASAIINAAGPWVDELRQRDQSLNGKRLHLTKGIHLVVPHAKLPIRQSIYFDAPDGRMIFAIPRHGVSYFGTTDTDYRGPKENPIIEPHDIDYLIESVNAMFPQIQLHATDIISSWAGLRPLIHEEGKSASELSRKDELFVSPSGLVSIAGGKLTGYRKMAQRTLDLIIKRHFNQRALAKCHTQSIRLTKQPFSSMQEVLAFTQLISSQIKSETEAQRLVQNYGKAAQTIVQLASEVEGVTDESQRILAEYRYCQEQEQCLSRHDFYHQHSGLAYFNPEKMNATVI